MSAFSARPTVSVALCTRNGEQFIEEQLKSILTQSLLPQQIVISDDDSRDGTLDAIDASVRLYRQTSPDASIEVVVLRNSPPLGVTANFESAVASCTGELIALCDQDDRWHPDRLERAVAMFELDPHLLLVNSDAELIDEHGAPLGMRLFKALEVTHEEVRDFREDRAFECLLRRNIVTGATTMFRSALVPLARPFPEAWVHDEWLAMIASAVGRVRCVEDALVDYRQHASNAIGARRPSLRDMVNRLLVPRSERNDRLLRRSQILLERLGSLTDLPESRVELAALKVDHETLRSGLPESRLHRVRPIVTEVRRGGYRRFSRGRRDVLRDLVQPA